MPEPLSEERLTELHKLRDAFYLPVDTPWGGQEMQQSADALAEAVDEIDRLRAENERLTMALQRFMGDKQYYCIDDGHSCYHGWMWQQHLDDCPVRIAGEALHPEPAQ